MNAVRCGAFLAFVGTIIGCASINSSAPEDRLSAVADLTTQDDLFAAIRDTNYEDVRIAAAKRLVDQSALAAIVSTDRFSEEVKCIALSSITNQEYLADVAVSDASAEHHAEVAARGVSKAVLLCRCAKETRFENVAMACVEKLDDELLLTQVVLGCRSGMRCRKKGIEKIKQETVLCDIVLNCSDGWVHDVVIPRLTESTLACRVIVAPNISEELKLLLVERIADESFLVAYVKNKKHPDAVRRKCLEKIRKEDSCVSLIRHLPALEDWVVSRAVRNVAGSEVLIETVLNRKFCESNRILASSKLTNADEFEKLFEGARDDLPIQQAVKRLASNYIRSARGQESLDKNFRIVSDDQLRSVLVLLMQDETLAGLYKKSDQVKIAKAIAVVPSEEMLAAARKALFDNDVIFDLAIGKFSNDDRITYWALDLNPSEVVLAEVALKSQNLSTQCRALARILDESQIARIALQTRTQALRMAAMARLSMKSEQSLNKLAQDEDVAIKTAAIERLKVLGGEKVAEFERRAEIERQHKAALEMKLAEEQKARDEQEKNDFENRYLSVAGAAQLSILRKYIELNNKTHIDSPAFRVMGRVVQFAGRELVLAVYCDEGESKIVIEMSRKSKENFSRDEIVTIIGYNDESTPDKIRLRCGELLDRGVGLKIVEAEK